MKTLELKVSADEKDLEDLTELALSFQKVHIEITEKYSDMIGAIKKYQEKQKKKMEQEGEGL